MNSADHMAGMAGAPGWLARSAFHVVGVLFILSEVALALGVQQGWWWLVVSLSVVTSHLMHGQLIGLHEAAHGSLHGNRRFNEIHGVILGLGSLMSFSLYRAAHQSHHANLASERDEELWPFVHPHKPRWFRVGAAVLELALGLLFTPCLFLRTFLRAGSPIRNRRVRLRIWLELAAVVLVWGAVLACCAVFGGWRYLLWMYLMPALLAGNMQSLRKYVEHVGLCGAGVSASTRSIVAEGWLARFISFTLLHEPYHGVHHWRPGLPHAALPLNTCVLEPSKADDLPPFRTYRAALTDLFAALPDPRVGAQWRRSAEPDNAKTARGSVPV